jgi:hypothetical protein
MTDRRYWVQNIHTSLLEHVPTCVFNRVGKADLLEPAPSSDKDIRGTTVQGISYSAFGKLASSVSPVSTSHLQASLAGDLDPESVTR